MKHMFRLLLAAVLVTTFAGTAAPISAETKKAGPIVTPMAAPRPGPAPAAGQVRVPKQPDLAAASLVIELVSTTKGQPGVEFPADKLKISGIVKDVGATKSPASFKVKLVKNFSKILATRTIPAPTAPGTVWTLVHEDTFIHGPQPAYQFVVEATFSESSTENNKRELILNDNVLHAQGRQENNDTSVLPGGVQVPGSVVIFF